MKEITWTEHLNLVEKALSGNGVFLVAHDKKGKVNPMTIGWGAVGRIWSIPTFTVLVRRSRYTYGCLLEADSFTVNVPKNGELAHELDFCGHHSGRELDKARACGLKFVPAMRVKTPVIDGCTLFYECRILMRKQLGAGDLSAPALISKYYYDDDYHMIVIGEIVVSYIDPTRV